MGALIKLGIPAIEIEVVEFVTKISTLTTILLVGIFGNIYNIFYVLTRSKLPRATNTLIASLSAALVLQSLTAAADYANHVNNRPEYLWGFTTCDVWNTLNVYFPMVMNLHCFFCLLDRLVILTRPEVYPKMMSSWRVFGMLGVVYVLPLFFAVPPMYFEWYTTENYFKWRTENECKFKTNMTYTLTSPLLTFWIPLALNAALITKLFKAMKQQDDSIYSNNRPSCEKELKKLPWKEDDIWRQHMLALTLWSIYWNVGLFWIPHYVWQLIAKLTDADWPRAVNFMVWTGYSPSLILPALYRYYNIYDK